MGFLFIGRTWNTVTSHVYNEACSRKIERCGWIKFKVDRISIKE
jgi:hypothetical protein